MTLTTVNPALLDTQAQYTGFKNRIINGAMVIDQRNAGAVVTPVSETVTFITDRFYFIRSSTTSPTLQQSTDAPAGFTNSLLFTNANTGATPTYAQVVHNIEGFNTADLGWGTANAQAITVSFRVKSSLTGTFSVAFRNYANNRSYVTTYAISAANTWETKTVTIPGDTSGTWLTNNGIGIRLYMSLGAGSDFTGTANAWGAAGRTASTTGTASVIGTLNATWQITGVQLEKGSTATSFDYRPYGTELALCQRYCRTLDSASGTDKSMFNGVAYLNNTIIGGYTFPTMRTSPTASVSLGTSIDVVIGGAVSQSNNTLSFGSGEFTSNSAQVQVTNTGTPFTQGHAAVVRFDGAGVIFSAEL
jgi:hypothetical protein